MTSDTSDPQTRAALEQILDHVRQEPSRTWSIIISLYGDAIVPRGGSVWLGTVLAFFNALGISDGVVRTAMSRLASDGWLTRTKVGRNSYYRLAEKGVETFRRATEHIYRPSPPPWPGAFDLLIAGEGANTEALRAAMAEAEFGSPAPGVFVAPAGSAAPQGNVIRLRATGDADAQRALAAKSWPLDEIGEAYRRFVAAFEPLRSALAAGGALSDLDALVARVLLIHEYRRIVLRDPILPVEVLPDGWQGTKARRLCAEIYGPVVVGSEGWLDQNAIDEAGNPLPGSAEIVRRFKTLETGQFG
ncbi:transcriptional repressor PaaX [Variibacter gotjawalensis]|uniref:Transcriptional repressor PaaX n=1 Tax=Variibacter gotjawalensis TaxID=1333996 RepID=A0A0S3PNQ1_9BRAD|nr:phenylacetic acid degradation operon negative regulatory protein PaaX [Variibacter gotjawalensis]NIK47788.1 phenylacetic acid degradation operon negative regulatory protein [Variibacter gotjawalensis]RZS49675.1 PaaX family transcriptional regulator [Variibacter gotjawalensis]BAT57504.1 transcriptional repressor PaaX [Variibacter gotjawalensis]